MRTLNAASDLTAAVWRLISNVIAVDRQRNLVSLRSGQEGERPRYASGQVSMNQASLATNRLKVAVPASN